MKRKMRIWLVSALLAAMPAVQAGVQYKDPVTTSIATLQLKPADIKAAASAAFPANHWTTGEASDTRVTGSRTGRYTASLRVDFGTADRITVQFLTNPGTEYHLYKQLLNIRQSVLRTLTDCNNTAMKADFAAVDAGTRARRTLVYALSAYHWNIDSITESRLVASQPARGRVEADLSPDGAITLRRWDEMKEAYTDPSRDGLVGKIEKTMARQQQSCSAGK